MAEFGRIRLQQIISIRPARSIFDPKCAVVRLSRQSNCQTARHPAWTWRENSTTKQQGQ